MTSISESHLTEDELAKLLNTHPMTLLRWRRERRGPPFTRIGRRILYRKAAVEAWLLRQEQPASA